MTIEELEGYGRMIDERQRLNQEISAMLRDAEDRSITIPAALHQRSVEAVKAEGSINLLELGRIRDELVAVVRPGGHA
jgi:hypothetical protein